MDEDEGKNAGIGTLTARGKTRPWGRTHIRHEPDEEDGLMMYANLKMLPSCYCARHSRPSFVDAAN